MQAQAFPIIKSSKNKQSKSKKHKNNGKNTTWKNLEMQLL